MVLFQARQKDATAGEQRLGVEMSKNLRDIIGPYFLRRSKTDVIQRDVTKDGSAPPSVLLIILVVEFKSYNIELRCFIYS